MFHRSLLSACSLLLAFVPAFSFAAPQRTGEQIYRQACAKCHGPQGQGVAGKSDEPLHGQRTLPALARYIAKSMPEDDPGTLTAEDATQVANYIFHEFYSPTARLRLKPARVDFSRLTVRQYRTSVADLIGGLRDTAPSLPDTGGLQAQYYASRNFRGRGAMIDRVDPVIDFIFEDANPDPILLPGDEFSIRWRGSVIPPETGEYEFVLKTENGARLWVNANTDGNNNNTSTRALIDAWVSSGSEPRENRQTLFLLGGRAYPIRVDFFRFKEKTSSVSLQWKPPHGPQQPIPSRSLSPTSVSETLVVSTAFPPDDASVGYERGISISKKWDEAATSAAIEVANEVVEQLDDLTGTRSGAADRLERVKAFCATFAQRAFRRPLTDAEKTFFSESPFADAKDVESGVKRSILLILKSPRFLYPDLPPVGAASAAASAKAHSETAAKAAPTATPAPPSSYAVASRLALALWDSVPDTALLKAAAEGNLHTRDQVAAHARRMLADPRSRSKVRVFLHHWLETHRADDITKDPQLFPGFNPALLSDLRASLDVFLDSVVWSESSDYRQLLLADYLYLNPRLAAFYGLTPASPSPGTPGEGRGEGSTEQFQKFSLNPSHRSGVLTHPFLLATLAYHKHSSPIHRGVFLTQKIVGRALKPPPMAVEFKDEIFDPALTMREKITELTRPAACQGCHEVINPLGFSLEHYDAVGRYRTMENNKPIDSVTDFIADDGKTIRLTGARDVAQYAATNPEAHRAFINQLFNHTVKQPAEAYGPETLEKLRQNFAASDYSIQSLLVDIATVSALYNGMPIQGKIP